jgi:hypothetical protein
MQFGIDQDVPSCVPRFNETKEIAWKNYCRPVYDKHLYFPSRFFEADVTSRYSRWWKQSVLGSNDFVTKIVQRKRSASSRKQRAHVGKANSTGNDVDVPPGFPPNLVDKIYGFKHLLSHCCSGSSEYRGKILPLKRPVSADNIEPSIESLEDVFEDAHRSKESSDRICLAETKGKSKSFSLRKKASSFNKVTAVEAKGVETVEEKERKESDHEVVVLLKEQYLKNQEELARLAKQQEEMLRLMDLREKRDEELRQLLTSVLRNQQTPSSVS